jgi:thiamine pyrophosphate-dependent acetolactate synthase large subunit-like protein
VAFNFPIDHRLYIGASAGAGVTAQTLFEEDIDLVFIIDPTKPWYPPQKAAPDDADIIWLDSEPVQEKKAYWNSPAGLLSTSDPRRVLPMLAARVSKWDPSRPTDWKQVTSSGDNGG